MDYFRVNGKKYEVTVVSLEENFNILYSENTGRTIAEGAPMTLDPLGTFYGHKVVVKRKNGCEKEFDELYKLVSKPLRVEDEEDALLFEVAHLQDTIVYRAYVSNGTRAVIKIDEKTNKVHWGELSLNIVPIKAQVLPDNVINEDAEDEPPETDGGDTDTITFTIDGGTPIEVDSGTTWEEWAGDKEFVVMSGSVCDTEYGFSVNDKFGMSVVSTKPIESGAYYNTHISLDGSYYCVADALTHDSSWSMYIMSGEYTDVPLDKLYPDGDYMVDIINGDTYLLDGNGNRVKSTETPTPKAYYLFTEPPETGGGDV